MTMPRPSLVTSSGPSPVRGFIAAMRESPSCLGPRWGLWTSLAAWPPVASAPLVVVHYLAFWARSGNDQHSGLRKALVLCAFGPSPGQGQCPWRLPAPYGFHDRG